MRDPDLSQTELAVQARPLIWNGRAPAFLWVQNKGIPGYPIMNTNGQALAMVPRPYRMLFVNYNIYIYYIYITLYNYIYIYPWM